MSRRTRLQKVKKGQKVYAHAFVTLEDGTEIFVKDTLAEVKRKMNSDKEKIELVVADEVDRLIDISKYKIVYCDYIF